MPTVTPARATDMGTRVRTARQIRQLTQTDLAEACGLTRDKIAAIEANKRDVSADEIYPLAKALGVRVLSLLGVDDEEEQRPRYRHLPSGADVSELEQFARTFLRREESLRRVTGAGS